MMFITPKIYKHSTSSAVLLEDHKTEEYRDKGACISLVDLKASSTLEAALVLPIFIYAVMAVMYFIQIMAVRSHINDALYMTLKKCAGYAYIYENYAEYAGEKALEGGVADSGTIDSASGAIKNGMAVETVRRIFIKELGKDYAKQNNIVNGSAGIIFISSRVLQGNSVIDIKVSYYIKNPFDIFGGAKVKIADRMRVNAWLGEEKDDYSSQQTNTEYVYITAGGEVYHTDEQCTYLLRYIKQCDRADINNLRNSSGAKYYSCQLCSPDDKSYGKSGGSYEVSEQVYYTEYGTRFHSDSMCSELRRDIQKVRKSSVADWRLCEKCRG